MARNPVRSTASVEDRLLAAMSARSRRDESYLALVTEAIDACRVEPTAFEVLVLAELLEEQAEILAKHGRFDEAIAAMREAVAEGLGGQPDARCRVAEILMRAGRVEEAEPIWAEVRAEIPGDVWLYNNAGLEYAATGDHATALSWLTDGLCLALDSGDPERLIGQLAGLRLESLSALGLPDDDLQAEAEAFGRDARAVEGHLERLSRVRKLDQFQAFLDQQRSADNPPGLNRAPETVVWSWLPADEYPRALALWPGLTAPGQLAENHRSHAAYCRAIQAKLVEATDSGTATVRLLAIRVDDVIAWCEQKGLDPATSRSEYVADIARTGRGKSIIWPPGRNDACWCGSGRKYKKCCAAPSPAVTATEDMKLR